jgi:hypothetical protein
MQRKHHRPIFWLDVDSRLRTLPSVLDGATCDVAGFLRGFRYLRDFDPVALPRFFAPFALFFNYTPRATAFLELLAAISEESLSDVSDAFLLQDLEERLLAGEKGHGEASWRAMIAPLP